MDRRFFLKSSGSFALACATMQPAAGVAQTPVAASAGYQRLFPSLPPARFSTDDLARLANGDDAALPGMSVKPELLVDSRKQPLRNANGELIVSATPENEIDD